MLIFCQETEQDIQTGYEWYKKQYQGLGKDFLAEIEVQIEAIEKNPNLHAKVFKNIHRALCKKFPYAIYFVITDDNIVVIGVLHQSRNPTIWKTRKA